VLLGPMMNGAARAAATLGRTAMNALVEDPSLLLRAVASVGKGGRAIAGNRVPLAWWAAALRNRRDDIVRQALALDPANEGILVS
jgi:hypothetical protein